MVHLLYENEGYFVRSQQVFLFFFYNIIKNFLDWSFLSPFVNMQCFSVANLSAKTY